MGTTWLAAVCFAFALFCPQARAREATEAEAWAVAALARGAARFAEREGCGTFDERAAVTSADACRTVGADILRAALLAPPGTGAAEDRRLVLSDAVVEGELDLSGAEITKALLFERVRFTGPVRTRGAVLRGEVAMSYVAFADAWSARGLRLSRTLTIADSAFDGDVDGRELVSDDLVRVDRTTFARDLRLGRMKARTGLLLHGATVKGEVQLEQSETGFAFAGEGSTFEGVFFAPAMRGDVVQFNKCRFRQGITLVQANAPSLFVNDSGIEGDLDLTGASVARLRIDRTRVSGIVSVARLQGAEVVLQGLHATAVQALMSRSKSFELNELQASDVMVAEADLGTFHIHKSRLAGSINGHRAAASSVILRDSHVEGDVQFRHASVKGGFMASGVVIRGKLDLVGLSSEGNIEIVGQAGKPVTAGSVQAVAIRLGGNARLSFLDVAGDLWISGQSETLRVDNTKVAGQVKLVSFTARQGIMFVDGVEAGGNVRLSDVAAGDIDLRDVASAGTLGFDRVKTAGGTTLDRVRASRLDVTRLTTTDLFLRGLVAEGLTFLLTSVDGTSILQASGVRFLSLQDATFGKVQLDLAADTAITLEDVRWKVISVPCVEAASTVEAQARCLRRLLDRNTFGGMQPYVQAAGVYAEAGHMTIADDFRFRGRQRQSASFSERAVEAVVGYGIGLYAYRVFAWTLGLSALAAAVLYGTVPAARTKGPLWCFAAGLNQLLPVVTLNKEFGDFFDDPERERLRGWHVAFFSILALIGWALGLFVVAAMAGLTQKV